MNLSIGSVESSDVKIAVNKDTRSTVNVADNQTGFKFKETGGNALSALLNCFKAVKPGESWNYSGLNS